MAELDWFECDCKCKVFKFCTLDENGQLTFFPQCIMCDRRYKLTFKPKTNKQKTSTFVFTAIEAIVNLDAGQDKPNKTH